jgi:Fe-S cluster assembly protein SufB
MNRKRLQGIAVDAVLDSVSVGTTFKETLGKLGIIFCSFSEAVHNHPELVKKYLGSVVPMTDNYYAALNSAVFSDGSFCYIPKGVRCPWSYPPISESMQPTPVSSKERLIIADEGSYCSYLEGCTAPQRDENQLHAAVVEIYAAKDSEVKYSTVQNWYPEIKRERRYL